MAKTVKVQEAKTNLSAILHEVEGGEVYTIARGDRPVARLLPMADHVARDWGFLPYRVPAEFFDPLPEDELAAWEE